MKLSIIIPTKNEEKRLPGLLTSIQKQTCKDFEVIVADNFSTDKTRAIAASFGARVMDGALPGPARNLGAKIAQGEMLLFVDADVLLTDADFLAETLREMDERKLDIGAGRLIPSDGKSIDHMMYGAYDVFIKAAEDVLPHATGACFFIRRAVHEALGGFNEKIILAEDHEYARRAKKMGYRFGVLRSRAAAVSVRRSRKEGRGKLLAKYAWTEARMLVKGAYQKEDIPFSYEFANFEKEKEEKP